MSYTRKFKNINLAEKRKLWGESVTSLEAVAQTFVNFISGKCKKFPFSEGSIAPETSDLHELLIKLNNHKMITINSQPRVNGASSTDAKYGWGPDNGYVY